MEFYELNRLYDENLHFMDISRIMDKYLYSLLPLLVSLGCAVSLLTSLVLLQRDLNMCSKNYLIAQTICNLFFQLVTTIVLITNNYEKSLFAYFNESTSRYLLFKTFLHFVYNILLYCVIWLFIMGSLDFTVLTLFKQAAIKTYTRVYYKVFIQQINQFNGHFNFVNKTEHNFLHRRSINPIFSNNNEENIQETIGKKKKKLSLDSVDMDEAAILELERGHEINFNFSNYEKNEMNLFCNSKKIFFSVLAIAIFSILLALPHYYAYEVSHNWGNNITTTNILFIIISLL